MSLLDSAVPKAVTSCWRRAPYGRDGGRRSLQLLLPFAMMFFLERRESSFQASLVSLAAGKGQRALPFTSHWATGI